MTNWNPADFRILQFEDDIVALFGNVVVAGNFFEHHPEVLRDIAAVAYTSEAPTPQDYFNNVIKPILAQDFEA